MRGPMPRRFLSRILSWWRNFRIALREYKRRNPAEWQYWGSKRIARQLGEPCRDPLRWKFGMMRNMGSSSGIKGLGFAMGRDPELAKHARS